MPWLAMFDDDVCNTNPCFSLNCQIAVQKYIDYYPAFELSRECKFVKVSALYFCWPHL